MKSDKKYKSTDRRHSIKKTRFGPLLTVLFCTLLFAAFIFALVLWGPKLMNLTLGCEPDWSCLTGSEPEATHAPTATPYATPDPAQSHALYGADLEKVQTEMLVESYQYLSDISYCAPYIVCVAGNYTTDGTAAFVRVVLHDTKTQQNTYLTLPQQYKSLRFPCVNENYVVYVDANGSGGGRIMSFNRATEQSIVLKTVHVGIPKLTLWGKYAAWIERTGSTRDKLFVCDVSTGESATVAIYNNSTFGLSEPCLYEGLLFYVDDGGVLECLDLGSSQTTAFNTGLYVHDPKYNGKQVAFITGNHGYDSDLYFFTAHEPTPVLVSEGVIDFSMGDGFVSYCKNDKTYVYFFEDGVTFNITRSNETSLMLGAGGDFVIWMDTTWRDKDILEYMHVTEFDDEG